MPRLPKRPAAQTRAPANRRADSCWKRPAAVQTGPLASRPCTTLSTSVPIGGWQGFPGGILKRVLEFVPAAAKLRAASAASWFSKAVWDASLWGNVCIGCHKSGDEERVVSPSRFKQILELGGSGQGRLRSLRVQCDGDTCEHCFLTWDDIWQFRRAHRACPRKLREPCRSQMKLTLGCREHLNLNRWRLDQLAVLDVLSAHPVCLDCRDLSELPRTLLKLAAHLEPDRGGLFKALAAFPNLQVLIAKPYSMMQQLHAADTPDALGKLAGLKVVSLEGYQSTTEVSWGSIFRGSCNTLIAVHMYIPEFVQTQSLMQVSSCTSLQSLSLDMADPIRPMMDGCAALMNLVSMRLLNCSSLWQLLADTRLPLPACLRRLHELYLASNFYDQQQRDEGWRGIGRLRELSQLSELTLAVFNPATPPRGWHKGAGIDALQREEGVAILNSLLDALPNTSVVFTDVPLEHNNDAWIRKFCFSTVPD